MTVEQVAAWVETPPTIYDAVHGPIDTVDATAGTEVLRSVISSAPIQRLRRIRQLDFASYSFPAADHSRFAHALGTMHVMRQLIGHITQNGRGLSQEINVLSSYDSVAFRGSELQRLKQLEQHMLLAALMQDIGELPYGQATRHIFQPDIDTWELIRSGSDIRTEDLNPKAIFTLGCIFDAELQKALKGHNIDLIVFLITGLHPPKEVEVFSQLMSLRHMVDGALDADRLDYVFRDAHHTVSATGSVDEVIHTIVEYDGDGAIVEDPGPVTDFLATRARLYSTVYLSATNRFRLRLLLTALEGMKKSDVDFSAFNDGGGPELGIEQFLQFDDIELWRRLRTQNASHRNTPMNSRWKIALRTLVEPKTPYEHFWITGGAGGSGGAEEIARIPNDLFFDTFSDQQRPLYNAGSIRVRNPIFRFLGADAPLETCAGPFAGLLKASGSILPLDNSIMVFRPVERSNTATWNSVDRSLASGYLYEVLKAQDPINDLRIPTDTRGETGYAGPNLFISFTNADVSTVRDIGKILRRKRRHYYFYGEPFQGLGATALENSVQAAAEADIAVILISSAYVRKFNENHEGYIATEFYALGERVKAHRLPLVVLSLDPWADIQGANLPWKSVMGFNEHPFVGRPLRSAAFSVIEEAVNEALTVLENRGTEQVKA